MSEAYQFLRHADRVRSLSVNGYQVAPSLDCLRLLSVFPIEICVFQRLLSLSWRVGFPGSKYLHLFMSPTLRRCAVLPIHHDLKNIGRHCPVLEGLSILPAMDFEWTCGPSLLHDVFRSCGRLVNLSCPLPDSTTWEFLSRLPTLVTLTIYGLGTYNLQVQHDTNFVPFLSLTALSFHFNMLLPNEAAHIITLLQHSEFLSLKEFEVKILNGIPSEQAEQIFRALSQSKACQTLERIAILFRGTDSEASEEIDEPMPLAFRLDPLFCFTQLRRLQLRIQGSIYNELLLKVVSSWPYIESLELEDLNHYEPAITFRGLFAALRLCPHLHTLRVPMNVGYIDVDPTTESFQHVSLRELHFGSSYIEDAEAVALIISSMLPRVSKVTGTRYLPLWLDVNEHLKSFAAVGRTRSVDS
jgi:hypothetical protein